MVGAPCPSRTFNITDFILPGRNYFLETGYTFSFEVSDPSVTSFRLTDVIRQRGVSHEIYRRLRVLLPENADEEHNSDSDSSTTADIFFGFLGHSSDSTYTPRGVRRKVNESFHLGSEANNINYLQEYLAIKQAISPKAVLRFGSFQGILYDHRGRIRGLKFKNKTFHKTPGSRGYSTNEGPRFCSIFDDRAL